jgi:hypothetical protein
MAFEAPAFYSNQEDFRQLHSRLKQTACPHCQEIGNLNLHGYLCGYSDSAAAQEMIRGRRIFCSNRGRRRGCGKTFGILAANIIKKCIIGAGRLWRFLKNAAAGLSKIQAFKTSVPGFSATSCYRIWNRFLLSQSRLRVLLSWFCPAPVLPGARAPIIQTIMHLKSAFKNAACPVAVFQKHFQTQFF